MDDKYYEYTSADTASHSELDATGKQSFDNTYVALDPRPYCETMQALDYVIPQHSRPTFRQLFHDYRQACGKTSIRVLDLGSSYGINSALLKLDIDIAALYQRYTSVAAKALSLQQLIQRDKRDYANQYNDLDIVGFDVSATALAYAEQVGLIQGAIQANLEVDQMTASQAAQLQNIDCMISSGCFGYITTITLEKILQVCSPRLPWMAHSILRMFPLQPLTQLLEAKGYEVYIDPEPKPQRRFSSQAEQTQIINHLHQSGVDTGGLEDQGWLYARIITTVPLT